MTIVFNEIPQNIRVPGAYIEIDATRAFSNQQLTSRILVMGQRLSTGQVLQGIPTQINSYSDAVAAFGQGSIMANMFEVIFAINPYTEKWAIALDDPAGVKAAGTLTVTGTPTAAGTVALYLGGKLVTASVLAADTVTTIAAAIAAAINANLDLPVTAEATLGVVDIEYRHAGLIGNSYNMQLNAGGESLPAGTAIAVVQLAGGTLDPSIATAIAALPEEIFDYWILPYTADTTLDVVEAELASRWSPLRMLEGHAFVGKGGTTATVSTYGNGRNSQHLTIMDAGNGSASPEYLWAAATGAQVAYHATIDPARPFKGLPLAGIFAPPVQNRRTHSQLQTLLFDGVATHEVTKAGDVQLQRIITSYQTNTSGVADAAYLDANTLFTLSYLRQSLRAKITSRFSRHKLADDNTNFGAAQNVATPSMVRAEIVASAGEWEQRGLIEDMETFKSLLVVERDLIDRNRINAQIPPNLINQLHIFGAQISFIL